MDEAHKELVKRLKRTVYRSDWDDTIVYANPDGVDAADALEALAGEVAEARLHEDCANGVASKIASGYQRLLIRAEAAEAERDRLKAEVAKLEKDMEEATDPRNWKSS